MSSNLRQRHPLRGAFAAVLAASLTACAVENTALNSERIEAKFGSYGIDVRENSTAIRRSNLFSLETNGKICRTYAVVRYQDASSKLIRDEQQRITAGGSIGATFKAAGWNVLKKTAHIGRLSITPSDSAINELMQLSEPVELALHIYQLSVAKDGQHVDYAIVAETHHPDYLTSRELSRIYPIDKNTALDAAYVAEIAALVLAEE